MNSDDGDLENVGGERDRENPEPALPTVVLQGLGEERGRRRGERRRRRRRKRSAYALEEEGRRIIQEVSFLQPPPLVRL